MALAGETEVIADHAERFICELQQMFPLFQFTAQYKCAECETKGKRDWQPTYTVKG